MAFDTTSPVIDSFSVRSSFVERQFLVIDKFPKGFLLVTRKSSFTPSLSDAFFSQRILLDEENQELYFPTPPQLSSLTSMHFFRKQKQTIIINSV